MLLQRLHSTLQKELYARPQSHDSGNVMVARFIAVRQRLWLFFTLTTGTRAALPSRQQYFFNIRTQIEYSSTQRTQQTLVTRCCQQVWLNGRNIDRKMSQRLSCIDQKRDPSLA